MQSRRRFLLLTSGGLAGLAGCGGAASLARAPGFPVKQFALTPAEAALVAAAREDFVVVTRGGAGAAVLRAWARPVPAGHDLTRVAARMERTMRKAKGVGIAGPQVGLGLRVATLMLDYKTKKPYVVFVRNPVIVQRSDETADGYEGCLSVPGVGGLVRRNRWIKVQYTDAKGVVKSTEAEGANAVLWQHELDHLNGVLYLDRLLGKLMPMDEVRKKRKELDARKKTSRWGVEQRWVVAAAYNVPML